MPEDAVVNIINYSGDRIRFLLDYDDELVLYSDFYFDYYYMDPIEDLADIIM